MDLLRSGDEDAARLIVARYGRRLIGLAAARLPAPVRAKEDEDDAVQSALKSFFNRHRTGELNPDDWEQLTTLLMYLTMCKVDRRIRKYLAHKRDVRREASTTTATDSDTATRWEAAGPDPTADEKAVAEETLREVLRKLSPGEQHIVTLRLQGYPIGEIATLVAKDERTIYRVLAAARDYVSTMLEVTS
jgi:RNA polymerase sigma factor (sigma-70 family)